MRSTLLILAVVSLVGCSFLEPQPDRSRHYVLTALAESAPAGAEAGPAIGLGPVRFPDYLKRAEIGMRSEDNEIRYSDLALWAEHLDENFARVLSQNLARQLNTERMVTYPWLPGSMIDYQISLEVLQFEGDAAGTVTLLARWSVRDGNGLRALSSGQSDVQVAVDGGGMSAAVAAMSRAVAQLSERLAKEIRSLSG